MPARRRIKTVSSAQVRATGVHTSHSPLLPDLVWPWVGGRARARACMRADVVCACVCMHVWEITGRELLLESSAFLTLPTAMSPACISICLNRHDLASIWSIAAVAQWLCMLRLSGDIRIYRNPARWTLPGSRSNSFRGALFPIFLFHP